MADSTVNVAALRKAWGWSQQRLARILDVSVRTIGNWERGVVKPHPVNVKQLRNLERRLARKRSKQT